MEILGFRTYDAARQVRNIKWLEYFRVAVPVSVGPGALAGPALLPAGGYTFTEIAINALAET